ncbi:MAG TPA: tRNA-binding protein [Candidatus Baltobacteraceae bacterium]|nr:tRNA-binding protein [Candidatus Baltobacteraceae bacterium]
MPDSDRDAVADAFAAVDIRAGTIVTADAFPAARKPAYKLTIDFGPDIGIKTSSAQITELYQIGDLVGMQIAGVVNLPPRRIAGLLSEVLVLGFPDAQGRVVLVRPAQTVRNGARLY